MSIAEAPRLIAFYLPQYHPIPENDRWWGRGFTEWTGVAQAGPQFKGHYQPHLPADLGFYDLRVPEVREAQADLARAHGIHGFCYYHYWFNGKRLLNRPFDEVLASGRPDLPFCLCWANENWTRRWDGHEEDVLMEQTYSAEDDLNHIRWLLRAFRDPRYLRHAGRPVFLIYRAARLPDPRRTTELWREEARRQGVGELFLCRVESGGGERARPREAGFDAAVEFQPDWPNLGQPLRRGWASRLLGRFGLVPRVFREGCVHDYATVVRLARLKRGVDYTRFRCVTPSWDNTARRGTAARVFRNATPALYEAWLRRAVSEARKEHHPFVFVNAWNEWGEGNHLEPDLRFGRAYLEATRRAMAETARNKVV